MKTKLALAALAAIGGLTAFAHSASANPDIRIGIGFNSPAPVIVNRYDNDRYNNRYDNDRYGHDRYDHDRNFRPAGFWREVVVKTWVPATYVTRSDWRGRPFRAIEPAHFAYRTERVWVSNRG